MKKYKWDKSRDGVGKYLKWRKRFDHFEKVEKKADSFVPYINKKIREMEFLANAGCIPFIPLPNTPLEIRKDKQMLTIEQFLESNKIHEEFKEILLEYVDRVEPDFQLKGWEIIYEDKNEKYLHFVEAEIEQYSHGNYDTQYIKIPLSILLGDKSLWADYEKERKNKLKLEREEKERQRQLEIEKEANEKELKLYQKLKEKFEKKDDHCV